MRNKPTKMLDTIREAFTASGMSIKRLSIDADLPYASAYGLVNATRDPALSTVEKVCGVLGLELRAVKRKRKD